MSTSNKFAERALFRHAKHPGSLRLFAHETLAELSKLTADPAFRSELVVEMIHRAWLFAGGSEPFPELVRFREAWVKAGIVDGLISEIDQWLDTQRTARTYDPPAAWDRLAPESLRALLKSLLNDWSEAHGMIVFVRTDNDQSVVPAIALPFKICESSGREQSRACAANGATEGIDLDLSIVAANEYACQRGWIEEKERLGLRLVTLSGSCEPTIGGASGGLAVVVAHRLWHGSIRVRPLELAASGVLKGGALHPHVEPKIYAAKHRFFEAVGVRTFILPESTCGSWPGGWPCGEALDPRLDELANEHRKSVRTLPPEELRKHIKDLSDSMRYSVNRAGSARVELRRLLDGQLSSPGNCLMNVRFDALIALAGAECHLGNASESETICQQLILEMEQSNEREPKPFGAAFIRRAVNLTDLGKYREAAQLCDKVIAFANSVDRESERRDLLLQALGTKGQALSFLGLFDDEATARADGLTHLEQALDHARWLDANGHPSVSVRMNTPRNLAYIYLWHALHSPSAADNAWVTAEKAAVHCEKTRAYIHRHRWLATYRASLLGLEFPWPANEMELPDKLHEGGWLYCLALKYRGTARATCGDIEAAIMDFHEAAALLDAGSEPLFRFMGATAALQAGESLRSAAPSESKGFLERAASIFREWTDEFTGPISGRLWLSRTEALLRGEPLSFHPQLHFPH